jgi:hypothetical protein
LNNGSLCLIGQRFISGTKRRESIGVREGSWGLCSQKDLGREARGTERRFRADVREGLDLDIRKLFPFPVCLQKL